MLSPEELHERGQREFEAEAFSEAAATWGLAYSALVADAAAARPRMLVALNVATAFERGLAAGDEAALSQALEWLDLAEAEIDVAFAEDPARAQAARVRLQQRRAGLQGSPAAASRSRALQAEARDAMQADTVPDEVTHKPGRGLVVGGSVMLAAGAAGLITGFVGLGIARRANDFSGVAAGDLNRRESQVVQGLVANQIAVAGLAAGGVFAVVGTILLTDGVSKRRRADIAVAPGFGRNWAGLQLWGRF